MFVASPHAESKAKKYLGCAGSKCMLNSSAHHAYAWTGVKVHAVCVADQEGTFCFSN